MASLYIDFGYDDNVKRSINSAKRAINSRIGDYNGIINTVNNTSSDTNNLWNANSYIRKKRDKLQTKWDKLDSFHSKIKDFNEYASDKDKAVADRIKEETNDFYKRENIKTGFFYTVGCVVSDGWKWIKGTAETVWDAVCTGAKALWDTIKDFYEKNKYWIDLVVDLVVVVAAAAACLASGGILATVFAVWGLATAVTDLVFDGAAFKAYYVDGDEEAAEELSNKGMKDVMETYLGDVGVAIYYGMEICSTAYDICEIGKNIKSGFKSYDTFKKKNVDILTPDTFTDACKDMKKQIVKDVIKKSIGIGDNDRKEFGILTRARKNGAPLLKFKIPTGLIGNVKFGVTITHRFISSDDNVFEKTAKTFKITKKPISFIETIIDVKDSFTGFASA